MFLRRYAFILAATGLLVNTAESAQWCVGNVCANGSVLEDGLGNRFGTLGNPVYVVQTGSVGTDYSANKPNIPNVGANFGATGIYANYVLIATVAANPLRNNIDVENSSGAPLVIVRDDGMAGPGAPPFNASIFALAGGSGPGAQGGSWASQTFKGRLQIYSTSVSAQVAVFSD